MKTVYLAGPIGGRTYEEATEWRLDMTDLLTVRDFRVYDPMAGYENLAGTTSIGLNDGQWDFERDKLSIEDSDILVANLLLMDKVSLGTVWELGYAKGRDIFTLVIAPPADDWAFPMSDGQEYHPFIWGAADVLVNSIEDAVDFLYSLSPIGPSSVQWAQVPVSISTDWYDDMEEQDEPDPSG